MVLAETEQRPRWSLPCLIHPAPQSHLINPQNHHHAILIIRHYTSHFRYSWSQTKQHPTHQKPICHIWCWLLWCLWTWKTVKRTCWITKYQNVTEGNSWNIKFETYWKKDCEVAIESTILAGIECEDKEWGYAWILLAITGLFLHQPPKRLRQHPDIKDPLWKAQRHPLLEERPRLPTLLTPTIDRLVAIIKLTKRHPNKPELFMASNVQRHHTKRLELSIEIRPRLRSHLPLLWVNRKGQTVSIVIQGDHARK